MSVGSRGGNRVSNNEDTFPKDGLPSRPMTLSIDEQAYWTTLMSQIPAEMLRRADSHLLATLCELLAAKDRLAISIRKNPEDSKLLRTFLCVCQQINRSSACFGLSPIDRRRMKLGDMTSESDDASDWESSD